MKAANNNGISPNSKNKKFQIITNNLGSELDVGDKDLDEEIVSPSRQTKHPKKSIAKSEISAQELGQPLHALKVKRNLKDLEATDVNKRTLLHRAALEQNKQLLEEIIIDFKTYHKEKKRSEKEISKYLKIYVNQLDKFGNSPLINACSQQFDSSMDSRVLCIRVLIKAGANPNIRNKRTMWSCIYWLCFYGEPKSIWMLLNYNKEDHNEEFAKEKGFPSSSRGYSLDELDDLDEDIDLMQPDYMGFYPLDLAGKKNNKDVVEMIITRLIENYHSHFKKKSELKNFQSLNNKYYESPLLQLSMLFWAVSLKLDNIIKKILDQNYFNNLYIEAPMLLVHKMTVFHACAKTDNHDILHHLLDTSLTKADDRIEILRTKYPNGIPPYSYFNYYQNNVLPLTINETKKYNDRFLKKIEAFDRWIYKYNSMVWQFEKNNRKSKEVLFIDSQELYGNTALHIAAMNSRSKCMEYLIEYGSDLEIENKEGFTPKQLIKQKSTMDAYKDKLKEMRKANSAETENQNKMVSIMNLVVGWTKTNKILQHSTNFQFTSNKTNHQTEPNNDLQSIVEKIIENENFYVPDFVIKFTHKSSYSFFKKSQVKDAAANEEEADRVNFYLTLLINAHFMVKLFTSVEKGKTYCLLTLNDKYLDQQCQNAKMRMKLIDSYNYDIFDKNKKSNFEPFRSRQRQEIISSYIPKIIDLDMLKREGLVECFFPCHIAAGLYRIRRKWVEQTSWYWPQPLNQISDYVQEGKDQNFTSITYLKQYLGEKISFFFAWKSFTTCMYIPMAILGLALQIQIFVDDDYGGDIIVYWVIFVSIWGTIIVELWKRKCSEINTRWGNLDIINDEDAIGKQMRSEFSGDEWVSNYTNTVTKYYKSSYTMLVIIGSIPILVLLLVLCIGSAYLIEEFKRKNSSSVFHQLLGGFLNGASITVLNIIYSRLARWFVGKENHKFVGTFENSLIVKSFVFRIINSFFVIFYTAYIRQGSNMKDLFFLLAPILVTKQVNNMLTSVFLPWCKYKYKQREYFKQISKLAIIQENSYKVIDENYPDHYTVPSQGDENSDPYLTIIRRKKIHFSSFYRRPLISLNQDENKKHLECDMDGIELNARRNTFVDTINFYEEGMIEFGYLTWFAAAFPLGASIAIFLDMIEVRSKIYCFLYILKRPFSQKCLGLGLWTTIWEWMSLVSVFSNIALLYFKGHNFSTFYEKVYSTIKSLENLNSTATVDLNSSLASFNPFNLPNFTLLEGLIPESTNCTLHLNDSSFRLISLLASNNSSQPNTNATGEQLNVSLILFNNVTEISNSLNAVNNEENARLWTSILMILIIILVKFLFRAVIQDKPRWVREEEEKHKAKIESKKAAKPILEQTPVENTKKNEDKTISLEKDSKNILQKIESVRKEYQKKLEEKEKEYLTKYSLGNGTPKNGKDNPFDQHLRKIGVFLKVFNELERELLLQRFEYIINLDFEGIFLCNECHKKRAVFECLDCRQNYCKNCYTDLHNLYRNEVHTLKVLNLKTEEFSKLLDSENTKYKLYQREDDEQSTKRRKTTIKKKEKENLNTVTKVMQDEWKKFELFSLPVYQNSPYFSLIEEAYNILRRIYIEESGVDQMALGLGLDYSKFFRVQIKKAEKPEGEDQPKGEKKSTGNRILDAIGINIEGKYSLLRNWSVEDLLANQQLSCEDKLLLNRIAFYLFRKFGEATTFMDFHRICKIMQEGQYEQKVILLMDILEQEAGLVQKDIVKRFVVGSFIKNVSGTATVAWILEKLFTQEQEDKKKILHKLFYDKEIKRLFQSLLQCQDNKNRAEEKTGEKV